MRALTGFVTLATATALVGCGSAEGKALCEAIWTEDVAAVEVLLSQGTDPNERVTFQGRLSSPWRQAINKLDVPTDTRETIALAALEAGGDPNLSWSWSGGGDNPKSYTMYALEIPARGGSVRLVEALIAAGVRVGAEPGGEALIAAAGAGQVEVLRVLVDAGAPLDYKSSDSGDTPLGAAVDSASREAIDYLDSLGAREW